MLKNMETFFWREVSYSQNFAFCGRVWELNLCKIQGMSDSVKISVYTCSFNLIFRNWHLELVFVRLVDVIRWLKKTFGP
jgi:hypothetical protein